MRDCVRICWILAIFEVVGLAQVYDDGIYATANKTVTLTPDQAGIRITASASAAKTLDDVLAALKDFKIGPENLVSILDISGSTGGVTLPTPVTYTFQFKVPLAQAASTLRQIGQIPPASDLRVSGSMSGVGVSQTVVEDTRARVFAELFRAAVARANQMAADAGVGAGRVLAITDTNFGAYSSLLTGSSDLPMSVTVRVAIQ